MLAREAPSHGSPRFLVDRDSGAFVPRSLSPALPAAAALRSASGGGRDLFSQRVGSPTAVLLLGATPDDLLRQALGRATAPAEGWDPGAFPTDLDRGWVGPVSVPGVLVEVMTGVAMAVRMRGEARVALLVDDTSGSASGDWHEGLNLAVVREAPLVLVNHDRRESPSDGGSASMAERAEGYGFGVWEAEATDPERVVRVCGEAVEAARSGGGVQVVDVREGSGDPLDALISDRRRQGIDAETVAALRDEAVAEMKAALARVAAEPAPEPERMPARHGTHSAALTPTPGSHGD
jgi:TPP-dependent pyruvate/acetoin dehydrogenase alpha subunit